jgi:hypothetical protein
MVKHKAVAKTFSASQVKAGYILRLTNDLHGAKAG